jgi:hypothetical protein
MTNNKQQTAVEWQHVELMRINFEYATNKITPREFQEQTKYILEQAKEIEKKQIVDGIVETMTKKFRIYTESGLEHFIEIAEQYREQTYGGNK